MARAATEYSRRQCAAEIIEMNETLRRENLKWLLDVKQPHSLALHPAGSFVAYVVEACSSEINETPEATLWLTHVESGEPMCWLEAGGHVSLPTWSRDGGLLAWVDSSSTTPQLCIGVFKNGKHNTPRVLCSLTGQVEWMAWSADARSMILLVADPGSYDQSGNAGTVRGDASDSDPIVHRPNQAWRRLVQVDITTASVRAIEHDGWSVLEAAWTGEGPLGCIATRDPSGSGWYQSVLARMDIRTGEVHVLCKPAQWYFEGIAISPDAQFIGAIEGYCSDAGLLSGSAVIAETLGVNVSRCWPELQNLTAIEFLDAKHVGWVAWRGSGCATGIAAIGGEVTPRWAGHDFIGGSIAKPDGVWLSRDSLISVRQNFQQAPELIRIDGTKVSVLTQHNAHITRDLNLPITHRLSWSGRDGLIIEGLLLMPADSTTGDSTRPYPAVVLVHGGPTWVWGEFFTENHPSPIALAMAGFAVLLPNPRGSLGRGHAFAEAVIGDIGGEDLFDIIAGVEHATALGFIDRGRVGIAGLSYGGFMAAWAPTQTTCFRAAVAIALVSDWPSCVLGSDAHDQSLVFLGDDVFSPNSMHPKRSPAFHPQISPTPTLIMVGADDRCTPPSQGEEMYRRLARDGVPTELVIYPREGHGLIEAAHIVDAVNRIVGWFDQYLTPQTREPL
jgi:dipeptidyl aminopeptidase/acylaminoacyl peptidase